MDYLTFIAKLVEYLAWPLAVIVILLVLKKQIAHLIEKPISDLLEKLKIVTFGKNTLEFDTGQAGVELKSTPINIPVPVDTVGLQKEFEEYINRDLNAMNIGNLEDKVKTLVSHLAASQIKASYERVHSTIFGSQIDLLRSLNGAQEPAAKTSLQLFYDHAVSRYKDFFKNYTLDQYVDYLVNMRLIVPQDDKYVISKFGKGYLIYLAENGLTGFRHY